MFSVGVWAGAGEVAVLTATILFSVGVGAVAVLLWTIILFSVGVGEVGVEGLTLLVSCDQQTSKQ